MTLDNDHEHDEALEALREADLWRRGELRQRATRVRELVSAACYTISVQSGPWLGRTRELLDELADAAEALCDELGAAAPAEHDDHAS